MKNPESRIVEAILKRLNALPETKAIKLGPPCEVGTPDLLVVSVGRPFLLEVKQPGEHPRPIQSHRLDEWRRAGATVGVVTSAEEAVAIIRADKPCIFHA